MHLCWNMAKRIDIRDKRDATIEELRESVRARNDFLAIAAHELRNPITPIKLLVQLLRIANESGDKDRINGLIGRLERQVERFVSRMNVLMDVSQITSGKLRLEAAEVNLSELIGSVIEEQRLLLSHSASALEIHIEEQVMGNLDSTAVTQIVDNLLSNAIKYGQGKPIEVSLTKQWDHAELSVSDHGIGIAPADRERIFERFERAVDPGAKAGFGIGLWVTRLLAEAMGGSIRVVGQKGAGSCFTVTLPLGERNQ